jgi:hypothetical protein
MVNIEDLRKKYEQINKKPGEGSFFDKFYKFEDGPQMVRILPWKDDELPFYKESAIHRIDDKNHHCPKTLNGEACPMCEFVSTLYDTKEDNSVALARQLKAGKRFYMNVVDRRDGKVKIMSVGVKLFSKILDSFFDEDYGDITDTTEGNDYKIFRDRSGQWPVYDKSAPRPVKSEAGTESEIATWLDERHDIHGFIEASTYEDLKEMVMNIKGGVMSNRTEDTSTSNNSDNDGDYRRDDMDYLEHLNKLKG